ncbi:cullin 3 [Geosmithia morbida]|uniref:Cullin 3 n=1 Tax=Geosmithia morbida TaxID=1094350 RepID=A0A9P4YXG7_9HYPO|nr:cullin 3 [Geosmithia morbida]KAF4123478.1 cullin 3 [Geosmithia morbida]
MISGRGGAGARGGRIRPPRRINRTNDAADFEACWELLEEALRDIHTKNCSRLSFEELYRAAYKIVLKKKGSQLYDKVTRFEEEWFAINVIPKIEQLVTKSLVSIGDEAVAAPTSLNERRQTGERFLKGLRDTWNDHNMSMNMMADILMYLDRGFSHNNPERSPIFTTTIALFRDHILQSRLSASSDALVMDTLISVMLDQINMEREGDVIDRALIRSCSRMLSCLFKDANENECDKLYLLEFEPRFLDRSREFYATECERLLRESDANSWLRQTDKRLTEEIDRCGTTIELETLTKVCGVIEDELIKRHLADFLALEGSGLRWMIDNDKIEDLTILYRLIARVEPDKTSIRQILQKRVVELGLEVEKALKNTDFSIAQPGGEDNGEGEKVKTLNPAAQQTAAAIKWVDDVLRLKDKFDNLSWQCFHDDLMIQSALTKSFSEFINDFGRSSEYVSLFIDDNLKRGIKGKTEAEVDAVLEKAIILIRYLQDKDLFQTYYQRHLARRLLHGKSESHDVEKQIISRMKQDMGQQFTTKFEGMFRDLVTSTELTAGYRDHMSAAADDEEAKTIDLSISVLTTNNWPAEVMGRTTQMGEGWRGACTYPRDIARLQASFEQFYLSNRNGRKLTWIGTTGSADIKCTFPAIPGKQGPLSRPRRYELNVSTFGMVVLQLFNDLADDESLSFEEIQAKTNISTPDLIRTLMAIAVAPKSRVLAKEPPTKSVKVGDRFSFNASFVSKMVRIKAPIINAVSKVEDTQERKTTESKNNQTRSHVVDAAIVRIMKSRKELSHMHLVNEVLGQLVGRFKPEVSLIKKRIEDLIVREYLERPDEDGAPSMYRYVA